MLPWPTDSSQFFKSAEPWWIEQHRPVMGWMAMGGGRIRAPIIEANLGSGRKAEREPSDPMTLKWMDGNGMGNRLPESRIHSELSRSKLCV